MAALVKRESLYSHTTEILRSSGIEVRVGELKESPQILSLVLQGVDVLISAVPGALVAEQRNIILAAKMVGVKRVIPCDWATPGAQGVRQVLDAVRASNHTAP